MNASDTNPTDTARDAEAPRADASSAPPCDFRNHQFGRRVEADRSWTVYHVFTGIPARVDGAFMTGLTRAEATKRMLALNLRNTGRQRRWNAARPFASEHAETPAAQ
ncbi:hypothetical protein EOD23_19875 [Mesorhizobium sp. USDA-HM6]|nr:hypothetical protein EOD23_19875 [Mesorhizobium sp. USDA-HM6]